MQWGVVGGDAFATDADAVARQVLDGVRPGSVVVLHCTRSGAPATERTLRTIVPALREEGYHFVTGCQLVVTMRRRDPPPLRGSAPREPFLPGLKLRAS